jgi:hypothetical protein
VKRIFVLMLAALITACSSGNLDYVKERANKRFKDYGFDVVAYDGYKWGFWGFNSYGGADVWYRIKNIPDNGITYTAYLNRWGDEIHIYGPFAIDAIRPR